MVKNSKKIMVAIAYDFDGTLAKGNIQEKSFIPKLEMNKEEFWEQVSEIARKNEMDQILAYMYLLITKAKEKQIPCTRNDFKEYGKEVEYFKGVETYFKRINDYAKKINKNIKLKHYIISSGTKEMIEGTSIAKNFKYIFASSYKYDCHGAPEWPALAINYTTKTQYLFRINKGIENAWDDDKINKWIDESKRPIPFENMIYIGDGATDIPAMKMINYQGGTSIGVYPPNTKGAKKKVEKLLENGRANYIAPANYSENSKLDQIIKLILDQISISSSLKKAFNKMKT